MAIMFLAPLSNCLGSVRNWIAEKINAASMDLLAGRTGEDRRGNLRVHAMGASSSVDTMNKRIATKLVVAGGSALVLSAALPEYLGGQCSPMLYALGAGLGAAIWLFLDA
jgi:hypothetical protein